VLKVIQLNVHIVYTVQWCTVWNC